MRFLVVIAVLGGCMTEIETTDPGEQCPAPDVLLRDPATGTCSFYESNACGGPNAGIASPLYPPCEGACEGLGELACRAHARCQPAYALVGAGTAYVYEACWEMGSGYFQAPPCATLMPIDCVGRSDCASVRVPGQAYHCEVAPHVHVAQP
jgi:hypothetical protein